MKNYDIYYTSDYPRDDIDENFLLAHGFFRHEIALYKERGYVGKSLLMVSDELEEKQTSKYDKHYLDIVRLSVAIKLELDRDVSITIDNSGRIISRFCNLYEQEQLQTVGIDTHAGVTDDHTIFNYHWNEDGKLDSITTNKKHIILQNIYDDEGEIQATNVPLFNHTWLYTFYVSGLDSDIGKRPLLSLTKLTPKQVKSKGLVFKKSLAE